MKLARLVFAGALLFGVGCELPEEGNQATGPRVDPIDLDDSTDYALDDLDEEIVAPEYAIDDSMALSSDGSEVMVDDLESIVDEENDVLGGGGGKKWKCCYCWDEDDDHDDGKGKDECYCAKDKKKDKAKKKAKNKCEDEHGDDNHGDGGGGGGGDKGDCEYKYCKKYD